MNEFQTIRPQDADAIFDRIGEQWMLISATDGKTANTMTASWGFCGILWHKPVAVCFIRPQRFTYPIVETATHLTLAFLPEEYRAALNYCGSHSGRDGDKFTGAGLTLADVNGVPYPAEAELVLVCRKLYADDIKEDCMIDSSVLSHYAKKDFHRFFICEIEQVLKKS